MPFPFILPTTSSFAFSSSFTCDSHPSLPLTVSTYRGVVKDELKKHKRLPPASQSPHVSSVTSAIDNYLPYLIAVTDSLAGRGPLAADIKLTPKADPSIEWRPTLSENAVPGREVGRVKIQSLEQELAFTLSTLAQANTLVARSTLHPLYMTTAAVPSYDERKDTILTANKHLLAAASIYDFLATRTETAPSAHPPPCADISAPILRGLASLALAEATLLFVLKDDPYPAIIAQSRNETDKEWMYKSPELPKVRAHLFARLCLAAAEHASKASSLCSTRTTSGGGTSKTNDDLLRYLEDTRRAARAKACRFSGMDAEMSGETGKALAWLRAGLQELGVDWASRDSASGGGSRGRMGALNRLKKGWAEKREDRRVEKETSWGADGGKLEETRVIEHLEAKWEKYNDMINTQTIPPTGPLLAQLPSGREVFEITPFQPPVLDRAVLDAARAPPDRRDDAELSSDEEDVGGDEEARKSAAYGKPDPVGAFPGTRQEYRAGTPAGYY